MVVSLKAAFILVKLGLYENKSAGIVNFLHPRNRFSAVSKFDNLYVNLLGIVVNNISFSKQLFMDIN